MRTVSLAARREVFTASEFPVMRSGGRSVSDSLMESQGGLGDLGAEDGAEAPLTDDGSVRVGDARGGDLLVTTDVSRVWSSVSSDE